MQKNSNKSNIKWIILGILTFCFAIIAIFMVTNRIHVFDNFVYGIIAKFINPTMTSIVKAITNFADPISIVVIGLIFSYIFGIMKKDRKTAILFCLNLVIAALFNFGLKNIFTRTRPEIINLITESGYSFPSGHSSIAMACYGYIIYIINKRCDNKYIKITSTILLSILIVLIGLSRVYLGVHFASDVIAAFTITLCYLIIYTHITQKIINK